VRLVSVHFDSDRTNNRLTELQTVLAGAPAGASTDVLCGDFNEDTVVGSLSGPLTRGGYNDALASLGIRVATHPWASTYYHLQRWAIIDHIVSRGARALGGGVLDFGTATLGDELVRPVAAELEIP
jgi:endonuclease/exonuclease/phosphatase family metal-dependent hydrolase